MDIHVLNHEGNVADCAGVAGLAALAHFKRPDVTLEGDVVTVSMLKSFKLRKQAQSYKRGIKI